MNWKRAARYLLPIGLVTIIAWLAVPPIAGRPPSGPPEGPAKTGGIQLPQTDKIPQLTEEERARVQSIATNDARVQKLISGRQYSVTSVGVWHSRSLKVIGGGVIFTLAEPASFEMDWPAANYDEAEATWPPYQPDVRHYSAKEVSQLAVLVDLQKDAVVEIRPGPGVKIEEPQ